MTSLSVYIAVFLRTVAHYGVRCSTAILVLLVSNTTTAQNIHRISYVIDSLLAHHTISANILIADDKKILFEKTAGFANINTAWPLQVHSNFKIAGLTRQFTAQGVLWLQAKGLLHCDSAVRKYLPDFPWTAITIRHLLTQTSGLPLLATISANIPVDSLTNNQLLKILIRQQPMPLYTPGTRLELNSIDYHLLALVIEQLSGQSYQRFMQQHIFRPARMFATHAGPVPDKTKSMRLASGHRYDSGEHTFQIIETELPDSNVNTKASLYGDASAISNIFDLFMWHRALTRNQVLPAMLQEQTTQPFTTTGSLPKSKNGKTVQYGFGWALQDDEQAGKLAFYIAAQPGYTSYYYRFMDKKICFIFLSNAETPANLYLKNRILSLLKQ